MTRDEAIKSCLENEVKKSSTKGVWASYVHRYKKGTLKEKTILNLLSKHGYVIITQEAWEKK